MQHGVLEKSVDSILAKEIVNYNEVKKQLSASISNIEIDKRLNLCDSISIIQFRLGVSGYIVRMILHVKSRQMYLLSFGRSDYLVYFDKGIDDISGLYKKGVLWKFHEASIADAVLPESYCLYTIKSDSISRVQRVFFQQLNCKIENTRNILEDGTIGVSSIFTNHIIKFDVRKDILFFSELSFDRKGKRMKIAKYIFPKIDVMPVPVIKRD